LNNDETVKGGAKKKKSSSKSKKTGAKKGSKTKSKSKSKSKGSKGGKGKGSKSSKGSKTKKGKERYFKLVDARTNKSYGRYTGETPKQAASKGYTKLLQKLKLKGKTAPKDTVIYLRESTRGSNRKVYGYSASRQKLPEPQELVIKDKETGEEKTITYHYRNKIKKVAVPEQIGGAKKKKSAKKSAGSKSSKKSKSKKSAGSKSKKSAGSKTSKKSKKKKSSKSKAK